MPRQRTSPFTLQERELIRLELMPRFGQEPELANGLFLRTWRGGPQKGQPKIPKAIQSMLDRGLARFGRTQMGRLYAALRRMQRGIRSRAAAGRCALVGLEVHVPHTTTHAGALRHRGLLLRLLGHHRFGHDQKASDGSGIL